MAWVYIGSRRVRGSVNGSRITLTLSTEREPGWRFSGNFGYGIAQQFVSENHNITAGQRVKVNYYSYTEDGSVGGELEGRHPVNRTKMISPGFTGQIDGNLTAYYWRPVPPGRPSFIKVPEIIKEGNSFEITWGEGTTVTSYHLERSIDGATFTQIYSGAGRSFNDTIPDISNRQHVRYRVRSYNVDGYSGYRTSSYIYLTRLPLVKTKVSRQLRILREGWSKESNIVGRVDRIWSKENGQLKEIDSYD